MVLIVLSIPRSTACDLHHFHAQYEEKTQKKSRKKSRLVVCRSGDRQYDRPIIHHYFDVSSPLYAIHISSFNSHHFMKHYSFIALSLFFVGMLTLTTACKKDPEVVAELLSSSEASEIIESVIAEKAAGLTMPTVDMTEILASVLNSCGQPGDTSYQVNKALGNNTYSRTFNMSWLVNCSNLGLPQNANFTVNGSGSFANLTWTGTTASTGEMTFTGLELSAPAYIGNGSYTYTGEITGDLRRTDPTLTCEITLDLINLTVTKSPSAITDGNGLVELKATAPSGQSITLTGTLVFNNNGTATLTINGHAHTFQLS